MPNIESIDAIPEQTMTERCVTITLTRYNELVEIEGNYKLLTEIQKITNVPTNATITN